MATTTAQAPVVLEYPLTTTYTAPTWCTTVPYTYRGVDSGTSYFWKNIDNLDDPVTSSCYPPNFWSQLSTTTSAEYSPGVCPQSHFAAVASVVSGVHTSICCPADATYTPGGGCMHTVTKDTTAVLTSPLKTVTIGSATPAVFIDWYIQVAWASSDLNAFTPASAPILNAASTASSASGSRSSVSSLTFSSASTSSSAASSSASSSSSGGISGGAIAGIVIGVLAFAALVLAGVFFFLRRRKHAQQTQYPSLMAGAEHQQQQHEVEELDSRTIPSELAGGHQRVELDNVERYGKPKIEPGHGPDGRLELPES